jgi:hypothetical protein
MRRLLLVSGLACLISYSAHNSQANPPESIPKPAGSESIRLGRTFANFPHDGSGRTLGKTRQEALRKHPE